MIIARIFPFPGKNRWIKNYERIKNPDVPIISRVYHELDYLSRGIAGICQGKEVMSYSSKVKMSY
jgi:hypothetical protein